MNRRIIKLTLAYDGTDFAGWQVQPGQRTVQGVLEEAISQILREPVRCHGAGRTDAGVHAAGQVAHFVTGRRIPAHALKRALNSALPRDVQALATEDAPAGFHARYGAVSRRYRYTLTFEDSVFTRRYAWYVPPLLDLAAMKAAAEVLTGEHDFATFGNAGDDCPSTVRRVSSIEISDLVHAAGLNVEIEANAFLYRMVRNVVMTLVRVGRGEATAADVKGYLAARDRAALGPQGGNAIWGPAPAAGLTLLRVNY